MVRNIQLIHAGKYICVVDTDVESLSAVAILIVKGKETTSLSLSPLTKSPPQSQAVNTRGSRVGRHVPVSPIGVNIRLTGSGI